MDANYVSYLTCYAFRAAGRRLFYKRHGLIDYVFMEEEPISPFDGSIWIVNSAWPRTTGPVLQKENATIVWTARSSRTVLANADPINHWATWLPLAWPYLGAAWMKLKTSDHNDKIPLTSSFVLHWHSETLPAQAHINTSDSPNYLQFHPKGALAHFTVTEVTHPNCQDALAEFDAMMAATPADGSSS